ncbi:MAG: SUMF1/EgtB/PvdO family nonheme iron enzyme, partial [Acidobacteriota bacterium]
AEGRTILLLDGLDEAADDALRRRIFEIFRDACRRWQGPVVVTSRPIATGPLLELGFHRATIEPFGDAEIRAFVSHWVAALHATGSERRGRGGERYSEALSEAIVSRSRVRRLAGNPVMLTCLCVVHWNEGKLPEGLSRVYRAVLRWLIAARSPARHEQGITDLFAWRAFARLALAMMTTEGGKRSTFDLEQAAEAVALLWQREAPELDAEGRLMAARRWLTFECLGSGVVEEIGGRQLRFWHLTFQEYLAALQLAWRGDGDDPEQDAWPVVRDRLEDAQWRETVELLPGCLLDEGGFGRVDRLLERVLALRGDNADLATEARVAGILGCLLRPAEVLQYKPAAEVSAAYEGALERSLAVFELEGAREVSVEQRIRVAEALGRAGDPRLAAGADESRLVEVPGLNGLRLGKYPVTVEEYQRFVEARGYEEPESWDPEGWKLRGEKGWEAPDDWLEQLEHPSRPVVGVSWYEADAYCRWLGEQRGFEIRLPTEQEWELAATPVAGEYPWGEAEPDEERANFAPEFEPNVGVPTPVGVYPAGNGRYGHCDLAGNVWEWSADAMEGLGIEDPVRVLRGGGWFYSAGPLRAAHRGWSHAADRDRDIGFRVLAAPSSL